MMPYVEKRTPLVVVGAGSRYQQNRDAVFLAMDNIHAETPIGRLVQGGCEGTDELLDAWALSKGIDRATYPAYWDTFGRSAGPRRNSEMLSKENPDAVIAFPGGSGTADLVKKARAYKKKEILIILVSLKGDI